MYAADDLNKDIVKNGEFLKGLTKTYKARFTDKCGYSTALLFGFQKNGFDLFGAFDCDPLIAFVS